VNTNDQKPDEKRRKKSRTILQKQESVSAYKARKWLEVINKRQKNKHQQTQTLPPSSPPLF
jgi:hypothetical protein